MNSFANYIKKARVEARLTQEEAADKLEVSKVTVQNWEKGKGIRRERFKKISVLYNVPVDELNAAMDADLNDGGVDNWPEFLFQRQGIDSEGNVVDLDSADNNGIVSTLHLNLAQQELFGIMCIYGMDYLGNEIVTGNDKGCFDECMRVT